MAGHRFAQDTHESHQAWLWVVSLLAFIYSFLVLAVRAMIKWRLYGHSDVVIVIAYAVSVICHVCIYVGLANGLGKAAGLVVEDAYNKISTLVFTSRVLMFLVLGLSRISVFLFLQRLFTRENNRPWLSLRVAVGFVGLWTIAAPLVIGLGCSPNKSLQGRENACCVNQHSRLVVIAVFEGINEILVIGLPIYLCSSFTLKREQKFLVYASFLFRLTYVPIFAWWIKTYFDFITSGRDNIGIVPNMVAEECLICYSLVLATSHCLRPFVKRFNTGGIREIVGREDIARETRKVAAARDPLRSHVSIAMNAISNAFRIENLRLNTFIRRAEAQKTLVFRPDVENQNWTKVFRGPQSDNFGLIDTVIRRDLTVDVEYHDAPIWDGRYHYTDGKAESLSNMPRPPSHAYSETKDGDEIQFITSASFG